MPTAEGYVKCLPPRATGETGSFSYVYQYKDHLGNVRLNYAWDNVANVLTVLNESHYYPFGLKHEKYNTEEYEFVNGIPTGVVLAPLTGGSSYKYKYQEQELQDELGLNWYSFKYRNYDPAIGRFMSIDPLTEKYVDWSPYVFSGNRVIDARELEGLEPYVLYGTPEAASENFVMRNNAISIVTRKEISANIYQTTDEKGAAAYAYTTPVVGSQGKVNVSKNTPIPEGTVLNAITHLHGEFNKELTREGFDGDTFSGTAGDKDSYGDMGIAERKNVDFYVGTPNGSHKKYDVETNEIITLSTNMPSDRAHPDRLNNINPVPPALELKPMEVKLPELNISATPLN